MMKILMILLALLAVGGGGAFFYLQQMQAGEGAGVDGVQARPLANPIYWPMQPSFVVNLPDGAYMRYLKVDVDIMVRDEKAIAGLEMHQPLLRNQLLMLFSSGDYQSLISRVGKEALQAQALEEVNTQLESVGARPVDALYFTNFVLQ